ncbi:HPr family phosphocarrier protein [Clostridium akagii]|uniref:HPr family phosphocarrier protein n=1 Tax=Clostridium akagii TaxID=91623 RepID=UPI00047E21E1|nr:HPr family phosphocarrier protein [Clostridium akagii]
MLTKEVTVKSTAGLHARPATLLVKTATTFKSKIEIEYTGKKINAKTLIGILSLGAGPGAKVKLIADGEDETKAIEDIGKIIENVE